MQVKALMYPNSSESCQSSMHKNAYNLQQYEPVQKKSYTIMSKTAQLNQSKSRSECGRLQGNGRYGREALRVIRSSRYM